MAKDKLKEVKFPYLKEVPEDESGFIKKLKNLFLRQRFIGVVEADNMRVAELSAITADLGTIIAGNITIDPSGFVRGGATDYLTGIGFFLGYSTDAYKFHVGNPAGDYMAWDGSNLIISGAGTDVSAGAILEQSADTERLGEGSTTYVLKKEIICGDKGTLRFKFDLSSSSNILNAYAQVWRNGVPVGTEKARADQVYATQTDNVANWKKGDLMQLYVKATNTATVGIRNFRVYSNRWTVNTN